MRQSPGLSLRDCRAAVHQDLVKVVVQRFDNSGMKD